MKLSDAIRFTFKNRPSWKNGSGAGTTRINIMIVKSILGSDFDCNKATSGTFILLQRQLKVMKSKRGKPYAPATINRITASFHTVLNELAIHGKLAITVPQYRQLEESGPRERFYSKPEIDLLVDEAQSSGDWELSRAILFAFKTGCRQGELLSLTVSDVDFQVKEFTFRDTKNKTDHTLPMTEEIESLLARLCVGKDGSDPVFSSFPNKDNLYRRFLKVRVACGMAKDCLWHTFRHTCGTHLAEAGVAIHAIAGVLNHKSTTTTLRYAKHSEKQKLDALAVLSA